MLPNAPATIVVLSSRQNVVAKVANRVEKCDVSASAFPLFPLGDSDRCSLNSLIRLVRLRFYKFLCLLVSSIFKVS